MEAKLMLFSEIHPFVRYVQRLTITPETYPSFSNVCPYDCRIFYVAEGKGRLRIDDEIYGLSRGQAMLWMAGVNYHIRSAESDPLILVGANFDYTQDLKHLTVPIAPDPVFSFEKDRCWEYVQFTDFSKLNSPVHLHNMQMLEKPLMEMLMEYKAQKLYCAQRLSSLLTEILVLMIRNIALADLGKNTSEAKLDNVLSFIHEHYCEELNNDQLGTRFGYHPNYLNRQIKLYTGKSLHQYLIHCRIARAIDLLVATDKSVSEIAAEVGFHDLCHFSRVFRQKTGTTPSALRITENPLAAGWTWEE